MKYNIKLMEELDIDTPIEWWNENRRKINEVIRMFNEWQIDHRQDEYNAELVLAKVKSLRDWNKSGNKEFNDWQIDILDNVENHVVKVIEEI